MRRFAHIPRQYHRQNRDFGAGARAFGVQSYEEKLEAWHETGVNPWRQSVPVYERPRFWKLRIYGWRVRHAYNVLRRGLDETWMDSW